MLSYLFFASSDTRTPEKQLPSFCHPLFNGRDIDLANINDRKNKALSLYELYSSIDISEIDVPITLVDAPMYVVCYSITECKDCVEENSTLGLGLFSVYNRQVRQQNLIAAEPTLSKENIELLKSVPILSDILSSSVSKDDIILNLIKFLLQLNVEDAKGLVQLGIALLGDEFPNQTHLTTNIHVLLNEFCKRFQKKFNLYMCCVEGQHRMLAAYMAWFNHVHSEKKQLTMPTLLRPNSTFRFYLNIARTSPSFQATMLKISNRFRQSRVSSVPSSIYHHLILLQNVICKEYIGRRNTNLEDDYLGLMKSVKLCFDREFHPTNTQSRFIDCQSFFENVVEENYANTWDSVFSYDILCKTRTNFHKSFYKYHKHKNIPPAFLSFVVCTIIDCINMITLEVEESDKQTGLLYPRSTFAYNFKTHQITQSLVHDNILYQQMYIISGYIEHIGYLITTLDCFKTIFNDNTRIRQKITSFFLHGKLLSDLWKVWADHSRDITSFIDSLNHDELDIPMDHMSNDMYNNYDNITISGRTHLLMFLFLVKETFRTPGVHKLSDLVFATVKDLSLNTLSMVNAYVRNIFLDATTLFMDNATNATKFMTDLIELTPKKTKIITSSMDLEDFGESVLTEMKVPTNTKSINVDDSMDSVLKDETYSSNKNHLSSENNKQENSLLGDEIVGSIHEHLSSDERDNTYRSKRMNYTRDEDLDFSPWLKKKKKPNTADKLKELKVEDKNEQGIVKIPNELVVHNLAKISVDGGTMDISEWFSVFESEQYESIKKKRDVTIRLVHPNGIQNIVDYDLIDVYKGHAPFIMTKPGEIQFVAEESLVEQEINKNVKKKNCILPIHQGYTDKSRQSSRRAWRLDTVPQGSTNMSKTLTKFKSGVEKYFTSKNVQYVTRDPSMLRDEGTHPHIQAPHIDYNPTEIIRCLQSGFDKPVVIVYGLQDFTLILYTKKPDEFGYPFGTRLKISTNCALVMAGDLYHSGDIFVDCKNIRLHCYCYPKEVKFCLYEIGRTYRDERLDITKVHIQHVTNVGLYYGQNKTMQQMLWAMLELRCQNFNDRRAMVLLTFLELYDYLSLHPEITMDEERNNRLWLKNLYKQMVDDMLCFVINDDMRCVYDDTTGRICTDG